MAENRVEAETPVEPSAAADGASTAPQEVAAKQPTQDSVTGETVAESDARPNAESDASSDAESALGSAKATDFDTSDASGAAGASGGESESDEAGDDDEFKINVWEQIGGLQGLIGSSLPVLVFVPVNSVWGLNPAIGAALAVAFAFLLFLVVARKNLQPGISGFMGVALSVLIAKMLGEAKGFFLYGIYVSLIYAAVFAISILVRWPLVGVIWHGIRGDGKQWRNPPQVRRWYSFATAAWALMFAARYVVKNHFYNADETNTLAIVHLAMGWPLTALVTLLSVFLVRRGLKQMDQPLAKSLPSN